MMVKIMETTEEYISFVDAVNGTIEEFGGQISNSDESSRRYNCGLCDKNFKNRTEHQHHVKNCQEGKYTKNKGNVNGEEAALNTNNRKDNKNKAKAAQKYKCSQCDKAYTQSQNLKLHVQYVHEGLKPQYKCPECDKCFTQGHNLKSHIRSVHKGQMPQFKCDLCEKSFTQSYVLKSHMQRVHKKETVTQPQNTTQSFHDPHLNSYIQDGLEMHNNQFDENVTYTQPYTVQNCQDPNTNNYHEMSLELHSNTPTFIEEKMVFTQHNNFQNFPNHEAQFQNGVNAAPLDIHSNKMINEETVFSQPSSLNTFHESHIKSDLRKSFEEIHSNKMDEMILNHDYYSDVKLKKLSIRVSRVPLNFCNMCEKYFCNRKALRSHNEATHFKTESKARPKSKRRVSNTQITTSNFKKPCLEENYKPNLSFEHYPPNNSGGSSGGGFQNHSQFRTLSFNEF